MSYGLPDHVIDQLNGIFSDYPQIHRVLLYGSRAKGTFRPGSDIDLCIEADGFGLDELFAIETRIDDLLLPWQIDLSLRHTIDDEALLDQLRRTGIPFFQKPGIEFAEPETRQCPFRGPTCSAFWTNC